MIPVMIEAALRSLLAGSAVALGLRVFRVRNVVAQKAAWGLVLASAFLMPLLLPVTARWHLLPDEFNVMLPAHPMTLLEELQARIVARGGSGNKVPSQKAPVPQGDAPKIDEPPAPAPPAPSRAVETPSSAAPMHRAATPDRDAPILPGKSAFSSTPWVVDRAGSAREMPPPTHLRHIPASPVLAILTLYCAIAALFLFRLVLGLFTTIRLWRAATPVSARHLPGDAASYPTRASSRIASPVTIGSVILLPADYKSWDSEKLRIVLAHERSHIRQGDFYLQLLAGLYAAIVWCSPLGWWLKHELAELGEAISDRAGMEEAVSRRSYAQILLEFAAAPRRVLIGVAMARPGSLSRRIERLLNDRAFRQCFAGGRRALAAVALVPLALFASTALVRVQAAATKSPATAQAATSKPSSAPSFLAAPKLDTLVADPAEDAVQTGGEEFEQTPLTPAVPAVLTELRAQTPEPAPLMVAAASPAPVIRMTPVVALAAGVAQAGGPLSFDRTLSVSGTPQLAISTGSGDIHITRGSGNQIHIHGRIRVSHDGSEEQARQIAANPPIEQNGDTVRVGQHQEQWRGISIDYQIEAPAGTELKANSGSGNIVDEGVGQNAKLETGSGDIQATSLEGPFTVKTGSGNISAAQTGQGDVVAETGSGDIEIKDIHGSFRGQTGSGDIRASGTPSASWNLQTGSGNVQLSTGNAPLTLDASTGSGSVSTKSEMVVQGALDHHHIRGNLNGGGPTVRVQTGSGDVQID